MLRIAMDSAGDMPPEWGSEYDIQVIPIQIFFGEKTYLQGVNLSNQDFYRMANQSKVFPKTSQPTPQQFVDFYHRIAQSGETILSVHVTSKLSGTYSSAEMAAQEVLGELNVIPIDSASGSAAMGYMAREARLMDRAGQSIQKIVERMHFIAHHVQIMLTLDNLEYARRSGRVQALQAALASLLNVKPVIALHEGMLDMADRVRTRRKSLEYVLAEMRRRVGNCLVNIAVVHASDPEAGNWMLERARQLFNHQDLIMTELSIGIAANLGPGTVGMAAYPVY